MSALTKGLLLVFGAPLLIGVAYFYGSLATGEERMRQVCAEIKPGASLTQVKDIAAEHGLSAPTKDSGVAHLAEGRTYGRFSCAVEFEAGVVKSSIYSFAD